MWTGRPKPAGPTLKGLTFATLFYLSIYILFTSVCVYLCVCTGRARLIMEHLAIREQLRFAVPPSQASTRDSVWFALCKQRMCAHSALSVATVMDVNLTKDTSTTQAERRKTKEVASRSYLSICRKSLKALVGQGMLDGCACNKRKAVINHCFRYFLSCEHQPKFIKRTLLKDRILIFNALQLHHTNQI